MLSVDDTFPFAFTMPPRLVGPDDSGGFYGAAGDVPDDGTWEVQTEADSGGWMIPDDGLPLKQWVRARPVPPEPYAVGDKVNYAAHVCTVIGVDGWWYWISLGDGVLVRDPRRTVRHSELAPAPTPEDPA